MSLWISILSILDLESMQHHHYHNQQQQQHEQQQQSPTDQEVFSRICCLLLLAAFLMITSVAFMIVGCLSARGELLLGQSKYRTYEEELERSVQVSVYIASFVVLE